MSKLTIKPDFINQKIAVLGVELTADEASDLALGLMFWSINIKRRHEVIGLKTS